MRFNADSFYREDINDDQFFKHLSDTSGVATIGRGPSRASFAMIYGLDQGYTLEQMENMSQEDRYLLGDRAVEFIRANSTTGVTEGAEKKALAAYGKLYERAAGQLLKEPFPQVVFGDPESVRRAEDRLTHIRNIGIDYSQSKEALTKRKDFVDQFGGEEGLETLDSRIQKAAMFSQLPLNAYREMPRTDDERVLQAVVETASNRFVMERYGRRYERAAGKSLGEAVQTLSGGQPSQQIEAEVIMAGQAAVPIATDHREKAEAYLRGEGRLFTREEERRLDSEVEMNVEQGLNAGRRVQETIHKSILEETVFDSWYQKKERKLRGEYRQSETEAWKQGEIAANMLRGGGRNSAAMWTALRGRENQIPFMNPADQPIANFLLSAMNRINEEADLEQLRVTTLMNMKNSLLANDEEALREMPDAAMRQKTLAEIDGRIERARKPLMMDSTQENMRIFIDAVFDQLSGKVPAGAGDVTAARKAFEELPEPVRNSIREGMEREIRERAPLDIALAGYTMDDFMDREPRDPVVPEAVTMRFEDVPDIDANTLTAHIARPSKLTDLERGYGVSTFDQAFGVLGSREQQERMKEAGLDMFDLITVNGKSVREQFGKKYAGLEPERQAEMFKCEVTAAALKPNQKISFATIEEAPDHTYELSSSIAVNRGGDLHEPKPTMGQRFMNFFGIRKITPLKDQMEQANGLKDESRRDFDARRGQLEGSIAKASMAHKGTLFHGAKRIDREYERLVGVPFGTNPLEGAEQPYTREQQELFDRADGFVNMKERAGLSSLGRPTGTMAILYGQMLNRGMTLKDIIDPDTMAEDKLQIARETNEALKTPEGAGRILAESTKAFCDMNLKTQFSQLLGQDIRTPDDMMQVLTARDAKTVATVQPAMKFLYKYQRELQQISNSFLPSHNSGNPTLDACRDAYYDHMDNQHAIMRQNIYLLNRFQGSNSNDAVYAQMLAGGPQEMGTVGDVRTAAAQAAIVQGLYRNLAEADTVGEVRVPGDQYKEYQEAASDSMVSEESARDYLRNLGNLRNTTEYQPFERSLADLSRQRMEPHWQGVVERALEFDREQLAASAGRKLEREAADTIQAVSDIEIADIKVAPTASVNPDPMPTAEPLKAAPVPEAKKPQLVTRTSFSQLSQRLAPPKRREGSHQAEAAKRAPALENQTKTGPRTAGR